MVSKQPNPYIDIETDVHIKQPLLATVLCSPLPCSRYIVDQLSKNDSVSISD